MGADHNSLCPHCEHRLRDHHLLPGPPSESVFGCNCGCRINGSVEEVRAGGR